MTKGRRKDAERSKEGLSEGLSLNVEKGELHFAHILREGYNPSLINT